MSNIKKVTVIGLGSMGSVLAKLLLQNNYEVTVWNRTTEKTKPLVSQGAMLKENIFDAIDGNQVIVVCVADYESAGSILRNNEVEQALKGKILIQLSTGTPKDALEEEVWAKSNGIDYVDGAIMVTPSQMGTHEAIILVSGQKEIVDKVQTLLQTLAVNTIFTAAKASTASALDLAFLSYFFSSLIGFAHAAKICEAEGLDIKNFGAMIQNWSPAIGTIMKHCSDRVADNQYGQAESTLQTCYYAMELISRQAKEAQITSLFPDFATSIFKAGMKKGMALEDGVAIFKVLGNE